MPVSLPNPLTDGTTAYGSQVKANDDALAGKFSEGSNGISDGDISAGAAIKGSKLSSVAGNRIATDRIEDDAVTFAKLKDDAASANRAVGRNHIQDAAVDKVRVSTTAGEKLVFGNLDIKVRETTIPTQAGSGGTYYTQFDVSLRAVAGKYRARINWNRNGGGGFFVGEIDVTPAPDDIDVATNTVLAVYLKDMTGIVVGGSLDGKIVIVYMPNT